MFNIQNFTLNSVREALSKRRTKKLLEKAELEESLKREHFLESSVNIQNRTSARKLEQSGSSSHVKQLYYKPNRPSSEQFGEGSDEVTQEFSPQTSCNNTDGYTFICNVFWKLSLTLNLYQCGNPLVDFGSLWPGDEELQGILFEAYRVPVVRNCALDLARLVVRCGPIRVLKALIDLNIIGKYIKPLSQLLYLQP